MKIIPLRLGTVEPAPKISARVARALARTKLEMKFVGSLATHPGSVHWHIVNPGEKGTLELTFVPRTNELWFAVHENRKSDWIPEKIRILRKYFEK